MNVIEIISGGQCGADTGGLRAAKILGIKTAGYMPKGFSREDGKGEEIAKEFNLIESDGSHSKRDRQNVQMCDGIIGFLLSKPMTGKGTTTTVRYAQTGKQTFLPIANEKNFVIIEGFIPSLIIWDLSKDTLAEMANYIRNFVRERNIKHLMISGTCESTEAGIEQLVQECIVLGLKDN